MNPLPSLRRGLLRHPLGDELLVYDPQDEKVHLLDGSTKKVVEMMDEGADADRIARSLETGASGDGADLLALALDQLALARLIEAPAKVRVEPAFEPTTRRQMVQRLMAASATVLIPTILTLSPKPVLAQTTTNLPVGDPCASDTMCASGCCASNSSGNCIQNTCAPVPNTCNAAACRND